MIVTGIAATHGSGSNFRRRCRLVTREESDMNQTTQRIAKRTALGFGLLLLAATLQPAPAHADPYRWCAEYGNRGGGGGTNCYFVTLQQCQAAISGNGGFCRANPFYTGSDRRRPATYGAATGGSYR